MAWQSAQPLQVFEYMFHERQKWLRKSRAFGKFIFKICIKLWVESVNTTVPLPRMAEMTGHLGFSMSLRAFTQLGSSAGAKFAGQGLVCVVCFCWCNGDESCCREMSRASASNFCPSAPSALRFVHQRGHEVAVQH